MIARQMNDLLLFTAMKNPSLQIGYVRRHSGSDYMI